MKIYFSASVVGKQKYYPNYLKIVAICKRLGYTISADHILNASEEQIRLHTKETRLKFHSKLEKWITSADCMIAETSFPSISVGYEISMALQHGKPVLILYSVGNPPSLLAYHRDEKIMCEKYSFSTLSDIIEDFAHYVKSSADMRFTFFITPEIAHFLEKISKKQKIPKSVYLRKLIEKELSSRILQ